MLQNGRLTLLRQLPPEHPQIPMLLQDIAQIQQDIDRSGSQLNTVTARLQQEKARGSNPSSLIGKVMAQLNGMNTPEAMNLLDTLGSIYTVDISASPEEIDKHLDMMPRLVETVFKTNRYVVGDDLSPKTSIPEAQSAQAWGTKTTNPQALDSKTWLSFNPTTTEDNNGSGLTYLP
jgi:hypothetical protein